MTGSATAGALLDEAGFSVEALHHHAAGYADGNVLGFELLGGFCTVLLEDLRGSVRPIEAVRPCREAERLDLAELLAALEKLVDLLKHRATLLRKFAEKESIKARVKNGQGSPRPGSGSNSIFNGFGSPSRVFGYLNAYRLPPFIKRNSKRVTQ